MSAWRPARLARTHNDDDTRFRYKVARHSSVLLRKLGDVDMQLQRNKITNLRLAAARLNNVVIAPGETFSFWYLVGAPTAERGFVEGLLIHSGHMARGVGGGTDPVSARRCRDRRGLRNRPLPTRARSQAA